MPDINIDLSGIGAALVQAITDHASELGAAMWSGFSVWLYTGLRNMFLLMWQATLLTIPHALTDQFGPVRAMMPNTFLIAGAAASLSMALLGLKVILQRTPMHTAVIEGVVGRVVLYVAVLGALPWLIGRAIDIEQQVALSVIHSGMDALVSRPASAMDFTEAIALVIMIVLGIRLWFKLASNVVHIAAAVAWSPLAMVCGLFPQTGWVPALWWREFAGRLAGAILATLAVGLGLALALGYPGLLSIAGGGGAFLAAADLVDWLARTPGERGGGVIGTAAGAVQAGIALTHGGAGAGVNSGAQAAGMRALARADAANRTEAFYGFD